MGQRGKTTRRSRIASFGSGPARAEPGQHLRKVFRAYVHVLGDPSPQHDGRDGPAATLFFGLVQHMQHDALAPVQTVADIRDVVKEIQGLNSVFSFFLTGTPLIVT